MGILSESDLEGIKGITELALEIARLKGELDAVKQERDYLRSLLDALASQVGESER